MDTSLQIDPRVWLKKEMERRKITLFVMGLQLGCSPSDVDRYLNNQNAPGYLENRVVEWLED